VCVRVSPSILGRGNDGISYLRNCVQTGSGAHAASYTVGSGGVKLTTHFHLVSRLRMHGSVPPFA